MRYLKRSPMLLAALGVLLVGGGGAASAATTTASAALVKGEFIGQAGHLADIGLSTNGKQVIAYLCDGTSRRVSLAQWFKGSVTKQGINITNAHGAHLVATVSAQAIKGTVKLKDGRSARFTARLLPSRSLLGLYRSEETFKRVRYLGGWIITRIKLPGAAVAFPIGPEPEGGRGGIINERNGALIVSPRLRNFVSVTVPHLGTFHLARCRLARC